MPRDNLAGSSSRCLAARESILSRCALSRNSHRTIDPHALKIPAPNGAESTLTENVASPFQAEPRHAARAAPAVTAPYLCSGNLSASRPKSASPAMKQEFSPFESKNAMEEGLVGCSFGCAHEAYLSTRTSTTSSAIPRSSISGIRSTCLGGARQDFQEIIRPYILNWGKRLRF